MSFRKLEKLRKFLAWEKVKNKKFFEAEIGIFKEVLKKPEPKKSHSYKNSVLDYPLRQGCSMFLLNRLTNYGRITKFMVSIKAS